jgi:hypothetical protein
LQPETETSNRYVRYEIDKGVIGLGKFLVAIVGLLIFIGLAFFAMDLKDALEKAAAAKSAATLAQLDAQKAQLDAQRAQVGAEQSKIEAGKSKTEAEANVAATKKLSDELTQRIDQTTPKLQQFDETIERINRINKKLAEICSGSSNLVAPAEECASLDALAQNTVGNQAKVDGLDKRVSDLERQRTGQLEVRAGQIEAISAEVRGRLNSDLRIREAAKPSGPVAAGGPTYYDLVFSVCIQNGTQCDSNGLENVERVSYYFDPRWFSPSVVTRDNRAEGFAYQLRVWGRTKVTACIYLRGETRPVARSGTMSLVRGAAEGGVIWAPEASKEGCASST